MRSKFFPFILMHFGFLFYSFYTVIGKIASRYEFLSIKWFLLYCALIFILGFYAILWQQVLKRINLSVAMANRAATIVWGMVWGVLIFKDAVSLRQIIGAVVIVAGIMLLAFAEKNKADVNSAASETNNAE